MESPILFFYIRRNTILTLDCEFIITPRILFNDNRLSNTDRIVLGLIISLTLNKGYCFATNEYLKEYVNSSLRTINYSLSKLKKLNYIIIKYENNKRKIYLNTEKVPTKVASISAKKSIQKVAISCNHNINSNKYKSKYNANEFIEPSWMKNPEICKSTPMSNQEINEMKELLKEFQ